MYTPLEMKMLWYLILALQVFQALGQGVRPVTGEPPGRCESLTENQCAGLGYVMTYIPNFRGHMNQTEAANELANFIPLVDSGCSANVLLFFCSYYFPFCATVDTQVIVIKPCRSICEQVRPNCSQTIVQNTNLGWPTFLNCSFDTFGDDGQCFGPTPDTTTTTQNLIMTIATTSGVPTTTGLANSLMILFIVFVALSL